MFPFSFSQRANLSHVSKLHTGYEVVTFEQEPINIFAAEVRHCEPHWHQAPELICVMQGEFNLVIHGEQFRLTTGGMCLISSNDIHGLHEVSANSQLLTIQFSPSLFEFCHHSLSMCYHVQGLGYYRPQDSELWNCVLDVAKVYSGEETQVSFQRLSLIYRLLTALESAGSEQKKVEYAAKQDELAIRHCLDRIDTEYQLPLTLSDLCSEAGLSYHHFSRLFKRICGFNFKDYLTFVRLSKSVPLLCNTSIPITEIALQCGFSEHKNLIAAFRKFYNMTPTDFRKMHNAGSDSRLVTPGVTVIDIASVLQYQS